MVQNRPGRPAAAGPRYDCGRRKPQGDPRGPSIWLYLRDHGDRLGTDSRLRTELGRLAYAGELTERQVDAGFLVARIYGEFERYKGQRRTAASPSYVRAFGDPHAGEDELPPEQLQRLEARIRKATRRFTRLQECFEVVPPAIVARTRSLIEAVCVEDRHVPAAAINSIAPMLDYIAQMFDIGGTAAPRKSLAVTATRPARRRQHGDSRGQGDKTAFLKCTATMRPDLTPTQLEDAWRAFSSIRELPHAKADRDNFRADTRRRERRRA